MKAIQIYLIPFILLFSLNTIQAQDDFYNNETEEVVNKNKPTTSEVNEENYYTEVDYNNEFEVREQSEMDDESVEPYNDDEIYNDNNDEIHKKRRKGVGAEIAAEIFVEVLYHTVFFVTLFWQ